MKKKFTYYLSLSILMALLILTLSLQGQISGIKTIPGDYPTIASAIASLNSQGVGSGGVTFDIAAGYTETFAINTAGLITATGTPGNPVIFRKFGSGDNPLVSAASGTGAYDYVFCTAGSDYITFDGIDIRENPGNGDETRKMEFGFVFLKTSPSNGSQYNTIKNLTISGFGRVEAYGIALHNWDYLAPGSQLSITNVAGANSWNKFFNLNFTDCYNGINLSGFNDTVAPFALQDQGNEVGTDGQNTFTGLGSGGTTVNTYGINAAGQNDLELANNLFTGSVNLTSASFYAMNLSYAANANLELYGNTVSINMAGSGAFFGIFIDGFGDDGTTNTLNISNNSLINNSYPNHTTNYVIYLYAVTTALNLNCNNNDVSNNSIGSPTANSRNSNIYYIYMKDGRPTGLVNTGIMNVNYNTVTNNQRLSINTVTSAEPATNYILATGSNEIFNCHDNLIANNIMYNYFGYIHGIITAHNGTQKYIYNNTIENNSGTTYGFIGLYNANGINTHIFNNKIRNITIVGSYNGIGSIRGIHQNANSNVYIYNNLISELYIPDAKFPGVTGIFTQQGTFAGIYNNTIYLDGTSTQSNFGSQGIWMDATTQMIDLRNNLIINKTIPTGNGIAAIIRQQGGSPASFALTSNNNNFYVENALHNRSIYLSPTDTITGMDDFKTFMAPRETASISENTQLVNITTMPYDLHVDPNRATLCESGAMTITEPVAIITDFDNQPRFPNPGYPNNPNTPATAPDIGADEFAGTNPTGPIALTGIKTIPGDYATIAAAITALNEQGVGNGGVIFNVAGDYTETFQNVNDGLITATGTQNNPITFRKADERGAPPLVTAAVGVGANDYVFCLAGSDYITFDGIDVQENPLNLDDTQKMEYGFAYLKTSGTDGAQHNTLKNLTITNFSRIEAYGIALHNWDYLAPGTQLVVTDVAGANSWNKFFNLNFTDCYNGISLLGFDDTVAPFAFYDQGNEVGKDGPNNFTGLGIGGTTVNTYGINAAGQNDLVLANNLFTGSVNLTTGRIYVMNLLNASNANLDVYANTITMEMANTGMFYGIYINGFGKDGTTNTVNVYENTISGNTFPNHTNGNVVYNYVTTGAVNANCYNNVVSNNTVGSSSANSTALIYYLWFRSDPVNKAGAMNCHNNTISNNSRITAAPSVSSATYFLYNSGSTDTLNCYNNLIDNNTGVAGSASGMHIIHAAGQIRNIYQNTVSNITGKFTNLYGLYNANGTSRIHRNQISNLRTNGSPTGNAGINNVSAIYQGAGVSSYYFNNFISQLFAPVSLMTNALTGIKLEQSGNFAGLYHNTIHLDGTSQGLNFGTMGVSSTTGVTLDMRNNVIINNSIPNGTGQTVAFFRSNATLTTYDSVSNNNCLYAGTPGPNNLIFKDGTNFFQTLAEYQAFVSPRDAQSISEFPPFVNSTTNPYDLHIDPTQVTLCESGAMIITEPIAINTDFDNQPRFPNPGYPNNPTTPATAPDIGADEFAGMNQTGPMPLTGIKTIPDDYSTIASAIIAINTLGVGTGGVIFDVAPDYTETFQNLTDGLITATGTQSNPITFRKAAEKGNNPLVTAASPGAGIYDYIFCLAGSDYITFDGIDVQENPLNTDNTQKMEYGFTLLKTSGTDGAQYNTIKNSTITLAGNNNAYGIYSNNWVFSAPGTQITVTDLAGTNSWNKYFNLGFVNCFNGIYLVGFDDTVSPYALYDQGNEAGKDGQNTFTGLGTGASGSNVVYGIFTYAQNDLVLANNSFTGPVSLGAGAFYGMYILDAVNANLDVYSNTVSIDLASGAGISQFNGISVFNMGKNGTSNTVNIYNNHIISNTYPSQTFGQAKYLYVQTGAFSLNIHNNNVSGNSIGSATTNSTGLVHYIWLKNDPANPGTMNVYNNQITSNNRFSNTTMNHQIYYLYATGNAGLLNINDNLIAGNYAWSPSGPVYGIYCQHAGNTKKISGNIIENTTGRIGSFAAIINQNGSDNQIFNNKIQNITSVNSTIGSVKGIWQQAAANASCIYNNFIGGLYVPNGNSNDNVAGIYCSGNPPFIGIYNNTIYLDGTSTTSNFGSQGIYIAATVLSIDLRNNLIINHSTPTGLNGKATIIRNMSTTLSNYAFTSDNNNFYPGAPGVRRFIYITPTDSIAGLDDFKAFVSPRESASISENTQLVNVSAMPYDLHVDPNQLSLCESGGMIITEPVAINTDFDDQPRFPNPGYPDNPNCPATAPDIGADEFMLNECPVSEAIILTYGFNVTENPSLTEEVIGVVDEENFTVTLEVLENASISELIASFTLSDDAMAEVEGVIQVSGETPNDFSSPVVYTVTGYAGNTQDWTVSVNTLPCENPWSYLITGSTHNISIPLDAAPEIFGTPLAAFDWIGVFFLDSQGEETCGGAVQWNGTTGVVVNAYGDDPTTVEKDGFATGEAFIWKLKQCGSSEEYTALAIYDKDMPNRGYFTNFGLSKLTSLRAALIQNFSFLQGWNSISSYIVPFDADIEVLFDPVVEELTIIRNLSSLYWPSEGLNTIGNWNNNSGYVAKFTEPINLQIGGEDYAAREMTIPSGWSYLPVLSQCEADITTLFGENLSQVIIIQELIGTGVFWPEYGINTIGAFVPGKAYIIKLSASVTVTFPVCAGKSLKKGFIMQNKVNTPWGEMNYTPEKQVTLFSQNALAELQPGDVIGAFNTNNQVCGYLTVEDSEKPQVITIFGKDQTNGTSGGYNPGEPVQFRLLRQATDTIYVLEVEYDPSAENYSGRYYTGSLAVIGEMSLKGAALPETGHQRFSVMPNPADNVVSITSNQVDDSIVELYLYDVYGSLVAKDKFINNLSLDISTLPSGLYMVFLKTPASYEVECLIKK